ncbi:MAG: pentapeptide repeat-containing protein [Cyanobacteria bacterium P01_F01_bin.116]
MQNQKVIRLIIQLIVRRIIQVIDSKFFKVVIVFCLACYVALWISDEKPKTLKEALIALFNNADPIAISSAAFVFILEIPDRKKRDHYEAWQVVNSAIGQTASGGRIQALEDLCTDGVDLEGLAAPGADLSGIDLRFGRLCRASFQETQLDGANLSGANLRRADLREVDFCDAKLYGADLYGADLSGADLSGADLSHTKLRKVNFYDANFEGADLSNANLSHANLERAGLHEANLSNTQWSPDTKWPDKEEVAQARNIPEKLKQELGINTPAEPKEKDPNIPLKT